jgi:hypothetical protein
MEDGKNCLLCGRVVRFVQMQDQFQKGDDALKKHPKHPLITEPAILFCIDHSYHPNAYTLPSRAANTHLYDSTRGVWKLNFRRLPSELFAFAIFHHEIVEVYEVQRWHPSGATRYRSGRVIPPALLGVRVEFEGTPAVQIRNKYIGRRVPNLGREFRFFNF